MLGFLSPANRGSMLTVTLLLFVLMGSVAGYCAAVTYKAFKGAQWKALTLLTAFLYPGITFGIFFVLNLFIWGQASSGAVPFGTMFALLCIWFLISFPLVWVGVWLGYRRELPEFVYQDLTAAVHQKILAHLWSVQSRRAHAVRDRLEAVGDIRVLHCDLV